MGLVRPLAINGRFLSAATGGIPRYLREILTEWRAMNVEFELLLPPSAVGGVGAPGVAWEQVVLPSQVRDRLLFSPSYGPLSVSSQVAVIHDTAPIDNPTWFHPLFARWYRWALPRLVGRVRHIITVSEFSRARLLELGGAPPEKVTAIPNGVSQSFHPERSEGDDSARAALGVESPYVLSLGTLEPRKNLGPLLAAWDIIVREALVPPDVSLVIAGNLGDPRVFASPMLPTQSEAASRRTRFVGTAPEVSLAALFRGASAFVYPSIYEGFGLPVLEAMASGTPVVAGRHSGLEEAMGKAGIGVRVEDPESIAEGLVLVLNDAARWNDERVRGLAQARNFSWRQTARRTLEVIATHEKG